VPDPPDVSRLAAAYYAARSCWIRAGWSGATCDPTTPAAAALAEAGRALANALGPGGEVRAADLTFRSTERGIEIFRNLTTATTLEELAREK
jgi:hypothetical protein